MARARARGGKIINMALPIPAGVIYTTGAPVLQGGPQFTLKMGPGRPNLIGALKFHDTGYNKSLRESSIVCLYSARPRTSYSHESHRYSWTSLSG